MLALRCSVKCQYLRLTMQDYVEPLMWGGVWFNEPSKEVSSWENQPHKGQWQRDIITRIAWWITEETLQFIYPLIVEHALLRRHEKHLATWVLNLDHLMMIIMMMRLLNGQSMIIFKNDNFDSNLEFLTLIEKRSFDKSKKKMKTRMKNTLVI